MACFICLKVTEASEGVSSRLTNFFLLKIDFFNRFKKITRSCKTVTFNQYILEYLEWTQEQQLSHRID